ncbi:MAG: hypothetical protein WA020_10255 [Candidatus Acidiferrales bacterium]
MAADEQTLDIFRILPDGSPLWVEAVKGREEAKKRIAHLVSVAPARYQVHDPRTNKFIDVFAKSA